MAGWIIDVISTLGYPGIVITMAIESALIPLPSEIIMPFSGYLVSTGRFDLNLVALAGAFGNVLGSLIAYAIGFYGHEKLVRRFIRKFGKWILISEKELDETEVLLHRFKDLVVLGSRVIPGIRTVISLPCGFAKLPLGRFIALTFIGSLVWSYFLAWIGFVLGQNWRTIGPYFHKADVVIVVLIIGVVTFYIYHKVKK
ncbi:MAG: DedA family protein [Candidatus Daviesbacteria bacterium]|nr:DedA family protein [Candidatus Daviesbacteria bacterium]